MTEEVKEFVVFCTLCTDFEIKSSLKRVEHKQYIEDNKNIVKYGGISKNNNKPVTIIYFLLLKSSDLVSSFLTKDPYYSLYKNIEISEFISKIKIKKIT